MSFLPLFLISVAGWLFPFFRWPWRARRAKLGSWGGPESITVERSSAQESNSDQLDVTYHHLFRPDRPWVHTKCTSDVETQTSFLCFLVIFSDSCTSPCPSVCLCFYLYLRFPYFLFPTSPPSLPPSIVFFPYLLFCFHCILAPCLFALRVNYILTTAFMLRALPFI